MLAPGLVETGEHVVKVGGVLRSTARRVMDLKRVFSLAGHLRRLSGKKPGGKELELLSRHLQDMEFTGGKPRIKFRGRVPRWALNLALENAGSRFRIEVDGFVVAPSAERLKDRNHWIFHHWEKTQDLKFPMVGRLWP